MDIRTGHRPQQKATSAPTSATTQQHMPAGNASRPGKTTKLVLIITGVIVGLALITLAIFWSSGKLFNLAQPIDREGYQAVFLSNNQVYFGKLEQNSRSQFVMKDVYYLQVQQPVQPQKDDAATQQPSQQASLSKLGNEVHGPEDTMYINGEHVLFWENLKDDSKVVQAIKENQKK